jgi:hypothetical protein
MMKRAMMAAGLAALWAIPAHAADNPMQVCGAKYQAAKKANQLPAGQTWPQFLATCRAGMAPAASAPAVAAKPSAAKPAGAAKAPSANQLAARDRQKKCGQMWSADKAAGKIPAGQTWPKYYSACNAKLKG